MRQYFVITPRQLIMRIPAANTSAIGLADQLTLRQSLNLGHHRRSSTTCRGNILSSLHGYLLFTSQPQFPSSVAPRTMARSRPCSSPGTATDRGASLARGLLGPPSRPLHPTAAAGIWTLTVCNMRWRNSIRELQVSYGQPGTSTVLFMLRNTSRARIIIAMLLQDFDESFG